MTRMKVILLALLLCTVSVVAVAPAASAGCPDPDNPCTPMPYDPFEGQCEKKIGKNLIYCYV